MKRIIFLLVVLSVGLFASAKSYKSGKVVRVIDGDTIVYKYKNKEYRGRFVGVDTFESFNNKRAKLQSREFHKTIAEIITLGKKAKRYTSSKLKRGYKFEFKDYGSDKYRRKLIWIKGLNYSLVYRGYATFYRKSPLSLDWKKKLLSAEFEAKENQRGIWE